MQRFTFAETAMATRFEMALYGDNPIAMRSVAEEAFQEISRLEAQLSIYKANSEVSWINRHAHEGPVKVEPTLFKLLEQAKAVSEATEGAFDITVAPLVRCWGFMGEGGAMPDADAVREARDIVGWQHLLLDPRDFTVAFVRPGVMIDLGAIGKGYALDLAAQVVRDTGVEHALLHGGTSSVIAIGNEPGRGRWKIAVETPRDEKTASTVLATVELEDSALSVSAVWGKYFVKDGRKYGHVIDPRTGAPAEKSLLAAVTHSSCAATDALSTALLISGEPAIPQIQKYAPEAKMLYVQSSDQEPGWTVATEGIVLNKVGLPN
ncbi:MAG: FAD:protein FMN transferase [Verrucomicrobiales bacterium]